MLRIAHELLIIINTEVLKIAQDAGRPIKNVSPTDSFSSDLQFSSLMLARLIIELQEKTDLDPFVEGYSIADVSTVGDPVAAYVASASA